ncbi:hypothetical protein E1B28_001792 [Marasmius oreades]|uniref:F-box domain-containing protein n=1 Tax=Marasmius oreades TaxID=181124 RepID=A0A9P8AFT6_9AGAR|nr:uncharacterized protein E1B28_001792 [Marasmius oreades]KAG7100004.1 hypothetical protein E1B28_001792 [Marasmius oreades]
MIRLTMEYTSRFTDVLNTNHTVSQQDADEIISLLVEPKQELAELDMELATLRSRVEELGNRRQIVGTFVDSHLALVSSFRRLPEDVMTEIFLRCLPTDRNPARSVAEAPLLLTRINKRCRDVVLGSPRLWSALHIYVPPFDEAHERDSKARLKRRAEGIEAWLKRSGTLPLSLSIVVSPYNEPSRGSAYRPLIHVLASFSSRWGTLVLSLPSSFMSELEKKVDVENLASLSSLQIDYSKHSVRYGQINMMSHQLPSADIEFTRVLSKAPEIRSLALQNYKSNVLKLPIAWDHLTGLELNSRSSHQTAEELFVVLRAAASSLEYCNVTLYCPHGSSNPGTGNESSSPTHPQISFPNLHTLKVHVEFAPQMQLFGGQQFAQPPSYSPDALALFFSSILAPSLTHFTFSIYPLPSFGFFDHMPFLSMINRSDCKIETFSLAFPVTTAALLECLQLFPSLKNFLFSECLWAITNQFDTHNGFPPGYPSPTSLSGKARANACAITDSFLRSLTWSFKNPHPICPHLQSMTISGAITLSETTIIRFARSRSPSRIKSGGKIVEDEDGAQDEDIPKERASQPQPGPSIASVVSPLKQLIVHFDRETKRGKVKRSGEVCDDNISPKLQNLRSEEGIKVRLTYPSPLVHHDSPWAGLATGPGANFGAYNVGYGSMAMGPIGNGLDDDLDDDFDDIDEDAVEEVMMAHDHHAGGGAFPVNLDDIFGGGITLQNMQNLPAYIYPMNG